MKKITEAASRISRPVKILQFGEGNFLRAFVDYMIDVANEKQVFNGSAVIVKPIPYGSLEAFRKQDNLYTVILRGRENGVTVNESRIISSVSQVLDCAADSGRFFALAGDEGIRFIVSNTTEAGIVLDTSDSMEGMPRTYPGKLTKWLYERYKTFDGDADRGVIILPVELIENNGGRLKECVTALCECWDLPEGFKDWCGSACVFCSTLVDRIVTGYPKAEAEELCRGLGYEDRLLDVGEPFALWVIESEKDISAELPLDRAGLPVIFTDDLTPYRDRKVRVLNGAHTASVPAGWLYGLDIVRDCMNDPVMGRFIRRVVTEEIAPRVKLPHSEVKAFADSVFERFENPFIDHSLLSISLNSVSKWRARVLPSFKDYYSAEKALPRLMSFSLAALAAFYSSGDLREDGLHAVRTGGQEYVIRDDRSVLEFFCENSRREIPEFVRLLLSRTDFWGEDLTAYSGLCETVSYWFEELRRSPADAVKKVLED